MRDTYCRIKVKGIHKDMQKASARGRICSPAHTLLQKQLHIPALLTGRQHSELRQDVAR
jgi:hypothetical protein